MSGSRTRARALSAERQEQCALLYEMVENMAGNIRRLYRHCERDELVSVGLCALVEAAARHDPSMGPLEAYVYRWVSGALMNHVQMQRDRFFSDVPIIDVEMLAELAGLMTRSTPESLAMWADVRQVLEAEVKCLSPRGLKVLQTMLLESESGEQLSERTETRARARIRRRFRMALKRRGLWKD